MKTKNYLLDKTKDTYRFVKKLTNSYNSNSLSKMAMAGLLTIGLYACNNDNIETKIEDNRFENKNTAYETNINKPTSQDTIYVYKINVKGEKKELVITEANKHKFRHTGFYKIIKEYEENKRKN